MKIITGSEFDAYWKSLAVQGDDGAGSAAVTAAVQKIIAAVRSEGDAAVRRFASQFDKSSPEKLEVPRSIAAEAWGKLKAGEHELADALELASDHIRRFSMEQKKQFVDFEYTMESGLVTGQRVIPVERAAIYVPGGRFPLISTVLMGVIPAICAGVAEVVLASPPGDDGLPDARILAAAHLAGTERIFAIGGAQAVAALAIGTETIPRVDIIAGPGNKYVAAAKRLLFGEVGIDFVAGPTDVLIIADGAAGSADLAAQADLVSRADLVSQADLVSRADLVSADMLAQAEHDPDARARVLVPSRELASQITAALERRLRTLPTAATAQASLDAGGLIIIYNSKEEALRIANIIAPEHLELQTADTETWIPALKNYGSLFIGEKSAEVLGDYSAGINHTLPTSGSARFSGGLGVRHFLKIVTTLHCTDGDGLEQARRAAEIIARAEGLAGHAESAAIRKTIH
ncbi:histidinol dehydrogenase [Spirochaetia bacterium]|nr:histidinol dehydrogenase [Spirochaetia bacterium]